MCSRSSPTASFSRMALATPRPCQQILGLALGGKTYKLKFGHRGANHPVINKVTQRVEITSHNHGFAVDPDSLSSNDVDITHVNLNDQPPEVSRPRREPVFCVQ